MIDLLVWLAVAAIVIILLWWILTQIPLPEPMGQIIKIVVVVIVAIVAIYALLSVTGSSPPARLR